MSSFVYLICIVIYGVIESSTAQSPLIEGLSDSAITWSSYFSYDVHTPGQGWDDTSCRTPKVSGYGWCPDGDGNPGGASDGAWVQADLGSLYNITSVSIWPRRDNIPGGGRQYTKTYQLSYSTDGITFTDYPTTLNGPQSDYTGDDDADEVNSPLNPSITARYLRFTPLTWSVRNSLRFEAYGQPIQNSLSCYSSQSETVDGLDIVACSNSEDACQFRTKFGQDYWRRGCTYLAACGGVSGCQSFIESDGNGNDYNVTSCCCTSDNCNEYASIAANGAGGGSNGMTLCNLCAIFMIILNVYSRLSNL